MGRMKVELLTNTIVMVTMPDDERFYMVCGRCGSMDEIGRDRSDMLRRLSDAACLCSACHEEVIEQQAEDMARRPLALPYGV